MLYSFVPLPPGSEMVLVCQDPGPQFPTVVNHLLKYGTNLLQAVGHFNGIYFWTCSLHSAVCSYFLQSDDAASEKFILDSVGHCIILLAFMRIMPPSSLPLPQDYVQPGTSVLCSGM